MTEAAVQAIADQPRSEVRTRLAAESAIAVTALGGVAPRPRRQLPPASAGHVASPRAHARMHVRHDYGGLLFDRRGEGASLFGRGGERDIFAAVELIWSPTSGGENVNPDYHRRAGEPKQVWSMPGAKHVRGIAAQREEYERRVVGFFDRALLPRAG